MTTPLRPTGELVAIAWLKLAVPGIGVATTLPSDATALRTSGFLQARTVGGSPDLYLPMRAPVVAVSCWAAPSTEGSSKPPWNRANSLAERIVAATYDRALMDVTVDVSASDYTDAHVRTVVALSEPIRVEDDPGNYARYDVDLLVRWGSV